MAFIAVSLFSINQQPQRKFCFIAQSTAVFPPMLRVSVMTLIIWGVAFNASSYMSETLRGALSSVSSAQMEASLACGMTRMQGFWHIVFPQAVRVAVPSGNRTT